MKKRIGFVLMALLAVTLLGASPASAETTKHKTHHAVSCKQIKDAIASGKSADEVAKDLKVSASRVKSCTAVTSSNRLTLTRPPRDPERTQG